MEKKKNALKEKVEELHKKKNETRKHVYKVNEGGVREGERGNETLLDI